MAVGATRLGDLVLVVREDQVVAAAVDVDRRAQIGLDHGRAFQVPARPARAPGRGPFRLARLGGLPQHEVGGMALIGGHLHPRPGDHVVQAALGQSAIVGEGLGVEQHVALGGIGAAALDQLADHGQHGLDMGGGAGLDRGTQGADGVHVGMVGGGEAVGDHADLDALGGRGGVYLVVHVGDVARIDHRGLAIGMAQQAEQGVEHRHRAGVADVGEVIDRGAAHIHRHPAGIARGEGALFAAQGVVDGQGHGKLIGERAIPIALAAGEAMGSSIPQ